LLSFYAVEKRSSSFVFLQEKEKKELHTDRNPITQRESNTLRLATDADIVSACVRSTLRLANAFSPGRCVFCAKEKEARHTKETSDVYVRGQEVTFA